MILVTLGTQDKTFPRLLEAMEKHLEEGNIKEEVVVQAGTTKFESKYMKIMGLIDRDYFSELITKCDVLITHGGVGSIITGLNNNKPVIATPRLFKYQEHVNDHQIQIIEKFSEAGYIIPLYDFDKIPEVIEQARNFKAKKYKSNTQNMVNLIEKYIDTH